MSVALRFQPLHEVCDVVGGGTPPKDRPEFYGGNIPWATVRDMRQEIIFETEFKITAAAVKASSTNIIPAGQVVIATRVGLGKVCMLDQPTAINQDLRGILPKNSDLLSARYLFWWFKSIAHLIEAEGTGATVKGVKLPFIKGLQVPVCEPIEQARIAGILDEAFDGIATAKANAEKNLQNARDLFASHREFTFVQLGDKSSEKPLGDICDLLNGFAFKSTDAVQESNTQLVRMGNLYGNNLDLGRSPVFYPDKFAADYRRYVLSAGDLIMSLTGTTGKEDFGYAVSIPEGPRTLLLNQRIAKFDSIKEDIANPDYLRHYFRSRAFLDRLYPSANGTRQANLSSVTMKSLSIPLCSIKEQVRIATALDDLSDECQRLESLYQQKLAALSELKKSLLREAFSGRL